MRAVAREWLVVLICDDEMMGWKCIHVSSQIIHRAWGCSRAMRAELIDRSITCKQVDDQPDHAMGARCGCGQRAVDERRRAGPNERFKAGLLPCCCLGWRNGHSNRRVEGVRASMDQPRPMPGSADSSIDRSNAIVTRRDRNHGVGDATRPPTNDQSQGGKPFFLFETLHFQTSIQ